MSRFRKTLKEIRYARFIAFHPFQGFYKLKHEKRGSLFSGIIILMMTVLSNILYGLYSGWLFNPDSGVNFNISRSIFSTLGIFFLWCVANWCLTCLFDGEGNFLDIIRATGYALLPIATVQLLLIPISRVLSIREAAFVSFFYTVGMIWCIFLVFTSVLVTHQYTFFKSLIMIFFVIIGMAVLAYIALLFFNLIQQITGFIYVLIIEIRTSI